MTEMEETYEAVLFSQLTNDEGHQHPWEKKYLVMDHHSLTFRESKEDTIRRGVIYLSDVVYCEVSEVPNPDHENILEIKTRSRSTYLFSFESESQMRTWETVFNRHKGVMTQRDLEPPPPPPSQRAHKKERYTISKFIENRRIFGGMWMVYLFIVYTIVLVVLFSVLWTQYVLPLRDITQESSTCYIHSAQAEYRWKKNYFLNIRVTYTTQEGEVLDNWMQQACAGKQCPSFMEENYIPGTEVKCYYDADDKNFVFFNLKPFVNWRYSICFGISGGLFAPWIICVLVIGTMSRKKIKEMLMCC